MQKILFKTGITCLLASIVAGSISFFYPIEKQIEILSTLVLISGIGCVFIIASIMLDLLNRLEDSDAK